MWWARRDFYKGSADIAAGVCRLFPHFGLAGQVPDKFARLSRLGSIGKSMASGVRP
jgi:hypothetical protein